MPAPTSLSHAVAADPGALGIDRDALERLLERPRREIEAGLLPGAQIALAREGRIVAFASYGEAKPASRFVIYSCSKALIASAVWMLIAEGKLDERMPVAELVPEFGSKGKQAVRVEHLLVHTAGFPNAPMGPKHWSERATRLARFADWRLDWEPGSRMIYHASSAHWVLGEMISRASGMDVRDFVTQRIADPLGLPSLRLGVPPAEQGDVEVPVGVGEAASAEEMLAVMGVPVVTSPEVTQENLVAIGTPGGLAVGVPGGGAVSNAADLALFYQALLHDPHGLWDPDVLADGTGRIRVTLPDPLLGGVPANRTLGLLVSGDDGLGVRRGFGHTLSARAFGHLGAGGQVAWADAETGLSFCALSNGLDANMIRLGRRVSALSSLAGACAGGR